MKRAPDLSLPDGSRAPAEGPVSDDAFTAPAPPGPALELARAPRRAENEAARADAEAERLGGAVTASQREPAEDLRQITRTSAGEFLREDVAQASIFGGALVLAIAASILPTRWRRHLPPQLPWAAGTMISGWAEAFAAAAWLIASFDRGTLPGGGGAAVTWGMYLLSPLGLLLQWHLVEGLGRAASAMTSGEPLGTAVLWLVAQVEQRVIGARRRAQIPERRPDVVKRHPDGRLCQVAASVRLPWDHLTTIRFEDQLYLVTNEIRAAGQSHPFIYDLALAPPQRVVRGLVDFVPFV